MLREEILRILNENYVLRPTGCTEQDCMAHDILSKVAEAVEKVENPYKVDSLRDRYIQSEIRKAWEEARQAFIKVIKEGK